VFAAAETVAPTEYAFGAPVHVTLQLFASLLQPLEKNLNSELGEFFVKLPALSRPYAVSTVALEALLLVTHLTHGLEIVASLATLEKLPGQL